MNETNPVRWLIESRTRALVAALVLAILIVCGWSAISAWRGAAEPTKITIVAPKPRPSAELAKLEAVAADNTPLIEVGVAPREFPLIVAGTSLHGANPVIPSATTAATVINGPKTVSVASIRASLPPLLEQERARLAGEPVSASHEQPGPAANAAVLDGGVGTFDQENARLAAETARFAPKTQQNPQSSVQFITDIECGTPLKVTEIFPTHYLAEIITGGTSRDWFMFRLHGAAGKTVRVDLQVQGMSLDRWRSLNPVYTYAADLDAESTYAYSDAGDRNLASSAWNGATLPATDSQSWHYIENCWKSDDRTFSFVQHFDSEDAFVAMRVPHPPGYSERFFQQLAKNPYVTLITVGQSWQNQPLLMARIAAGGDDGQKRKPCILIYAGEHADEQDSMWAAQGGIEFMASDRPEAARLRDQFTVLVIPMLDPAVSAIGQHSGIITTFRSNANSKESNAYANWFQQWVRTGHRLDIVLNLHNVQSGESPDVACPILEGKGTRGEISFAFDQMVLDDLVAGGYHVNRRPWMRGWSPDRLGGWLSRRYGPITLAYELNSQATEHHLNLIQLKNMGASMLRATGLFLASSNGSALLANVDDRRKEWADSWAKYGAGVTESDAIQSELKLSRAANLRSDPYDPAGELWVN